MNRPLMHPQQMSVMNLKQKLDRLRDHCAPRVMAQLNDSAPRMPESCSRNRAKWSSGGCSIRAPGRLLAAGMTLSRSVYT
jgi:hypothetical protein